MMKKVILFILCIANCFSVDSQVNSTDNSTSLIEVKNQFNINTENTDFAPSYWTEYIVFTSSKKRQKFFDPNTNEAFFDLYLTAINKENELDRSAQLSKVLNTTYHEATSCFSNDDKHIYFSRMDDEGFMNIYESDYINGEWEEATPTVFNEEESQSVHPTVSQDGKSILFASNRAGGYGLMDLYYSNYENGEWTEPLNLGPKVNTSGNELFPFIAQNNFVFFSSDGYKRKGDLDIFKFSIVDNESSQPIPLPAPINSNYDDLSLICNYEGKSGFFSSNRPGGVGKDDIYNFSSHQSIFGYGEDSYNVISIFTKDKESKAPLTDVIIRYRHLEEGETLLFDKTLFDFTKTKFDSIQVDNKGRVQIKLDEGYTIIEAESKSKEKWQVAVTNKLEDKTLDIFLEDKIEIQKPKNIVKEEIQTIKNTKLNVGTILVFDNIYYDSNSHEIKKGAAIELDELAELMNSNKKIKVQLSSHTDSSGEDDYNLLLSEKRAISAKEHIIQKGVHPNRIFTIGYGETKLRNHCKDGVVCTEEEHSFNRRTEVKILEK